MVKHEGRGDRHLTASKLRSLRRTYDSHRSLLAYHLQWLLLGAFTLFVAHVQIATRLLGAACPPLYWYAALRLVEEEKYEQQQQVKRKGGRTERRFLAFIIVYYALYNMLGPLLHFNFFPWT